MLQKIISKSDSLAKIRCISRITCLSTYFNHKFAVSACISRRCRFVSTKSEPAKDYGYIPSENIRNFAIIAHIDHGKSTLGDRLLEVTGTIVKDEKTSQVLDRLQVERDRGITVKAQTATMFYKYEGIEYMFNLIDTPGHVDFNSEVTRSLSACQGCLLLVDATQGIQAQTVSNYYLAKDQNLKIIPVINKIDMPNADVERVSAQIRDQFELETNSIILCSAKTGAGVDKIIPAIIRHVPCPSGLRRGNLKALLIDSWYDKYKGVVCVVRIFEGQITKQDRIQSNYTKQVYDVTEVGIMTPERQVCKSLYAGQVGYITCAMKQSSEAFVGDTFYRLGHKVEPLPGFVPVKPTVYVGAFPKNNEQFDKIDFSIQHLMLNDRSLSVCKESSDALGNGWRIGCSGSLHLSVFIERLRYEHGGEIVITAPMVEVKILYPDGSHKLIKNPNEFPNAVEIKAKKLQIQEPVIKCNIITPADYIGSIIELCELYQGEQTKLDYSSESKVFITYILPLNALFEDFVGKLKSLSKGYASFEYEPSGYRNSDLVKLQLLVNKEPVDALSQIVHTSKAQKCGREWTIRLKDLLQRQQFQVIVQAAVGSDILARETISALRKDVTAKLYGGDYTRRLKLLENQKKGKKKMQKIGKVSVDQSAFHKFLEKSFQF